MSPVRWPGLHRSRQRKHAVRAGELTLAAALPGWRLVGCLTAYSDWRNSRAAAVTLLRTWRHRSRSRRELGQLSEAELPDMRISRCDATAEASKPFWRA